VEKEKGREKLNGFFSVREGTVSFFSKKERRFFSFGQRRGQTYACAVAYVEARSYRHGLKTRTRALRFHKGISTISRPENTPDFGYYMTTAFSYNMVSMRKCPSIKCQISIL